MHQRELASSSAARSPGAHRGGQRRAAFGPVILVIEADHQIRGFLARVLRAEGHDVHTAVDAASAMSLLALAPHAVVMAVDLPDADGRDLCRALREREGDVPLILLGSRPAGSGGIAELLSSFEAGADDYLFPPYSAPVLVARLGALLRRTGPNLDIEVGDLRLDPLNLELWSGSVSVSMSPIEFRLVARLAGGRGQLVSRRELVSAGWAPGAFVSSNTLDQYLSRLRRKLRASGSMQTISNVRGVGYRLCYQAREVGHDAGYGRFD